MAAYYNEYDPFAAAWLRELIRAGHIAPGEVDERSIEDVLPSELRGFTQCHFFAGIGVWSYALRQAGWPDDREVWTGSCPCQPFSAAGKRGGVADERHLWPAFYHLIRECSPRVVFGEQVASKDGLAWFSTVSADLEAARYAIGGVDLCAAGFGAPHIRQRLYLVADADRTGTSKEWQQRGGEFLQSCEDESAGIGMADSEHAECGTERGILGEAYGRDGFGGGRDSSILEHPASEQTGLPPRRLGLADSAGSQSWDCTTETARQGHSTLTAGFWAEPEWVFCRDQKFRPIEPGSSPLATGITNRVGKLRGYGNALCAPVAQGFIEAYLETEKE